MDEGRRVIPVEVTVSNEVELASDISLVLTPMIAPDDFTPLPTTRLFARANTCKLYTFLCNSDEYYYHSDYS